MNSAIFLEIVLSLQITIVHVDRMGNTDSHFFQGYIRWILMDRFLAHEIFRVGLTNSRSCRRRNNLYCRRVSIPADLPREDITHGVSDWNKCQ